MERAELCVCSGSCQGAWRKAAPVIGSCHLLSAGDSALIVTFWNMIFLHNALIQLALLSRYPALGVSMLTIKKKKSATVILTPESITN